MPDDSKTRSSIPANDVTSFDIDPPYELQIHEVVFGFEIVAEVHRGGFGILYKAKKDGTDFAVKQLLPEYAQNKEQQRRLQREAFLNQHPDRPECVCSLQKDCSGDPRRFIVLNWLEGQTLSERFGRSPVHSDLLLHLSIQVASLLPKLHSSGYLHRDFHFGNVMVLSDGSLVVLDLGLSVAPQLPLSREMIAEIRDISRDQVDLGTNQFRSPPGSLQVLHPGFYEDLDLKEERDVYALGCQLYRLATGFYPYERCDCRDSNGNHLGTVATRQHHVPPPLPGTVPTAFADLVRRLLDWKSALYPTAIEVVAELAAILAQEHGVLAGRANLEPSAILQHAAIRRFIDDLENLETKVRELAGEPLELHYSGFPIGDVKQLLSTVFQKFWLSSHHDMKHLQKCSHVLPSGTEVRQALHVMRNQFMRWQRETYAQLEQSILDQNPADAEEAMRQRFDEFNRQLRNYSTELNELSGQRESEVSLLRDVF